jgi:hypothetical protein
MINPAVCKTVDHWLLSPGPFSTKNWPTKYFIFSKTGQSGGFLNPGKCGLNLLSAASASAGKGNIPPGESI